MDELKYCAYQLGMNSLLYFKDTDSWVRLCVPELKHQEVLKGVHDEAHKSAHAGWECTLALLRDQLYWPCMRSDVIKYMQTCNPCQKIKHNWGVGARFLQPLEIPATPFEDISLNLITRLPSSNHKDAILVVVNKLMKYAHFIATTAKISALEVATLLFKRIVKHFGLPTRIIGDHNPRWTSSVWKALTQLFRTWLPLSTSRHPQMDGQMEVMNQHLKTMVWAYIKPNQKDWPQWLDMLQFTYNNATHSSHHSTLAKLLMGYKPRSPLNFIIGKGLIASEGTPNLQWRIQDLHAHQSMVQDAIKHSTDWQAYQFDKGCNTPNLIVGDEVLINPHSLKLINKKGFSHKLMQWKTGPFEVIEVIKPTAYKLQLPNSYKGHNVFNLQHLTKYHQSNDVECPKLMNMQDALAHSMDGVLFHACSWMDYSWFMTTTPAVSQYFIMYWMQ